MWARNLLPAKLKQSNQNQRISEDCYCWVLELQAILRYFCIWWTFRLVEYVHTGLFGLHFISSQVPEQPNNPALHICCYTVLFSVCSLGQIHGLQRLWQNARLVISIQYDNRKKWWYKSKDNIWCSSLVLQAATGHKDQVHPCLMTTLITDVPHLW